jgi:hypothetical protein
MSRRTQFAVALIKYLPALAILVVGAFYVVTQVDRALRSANLIFSEQLTNRLGRLVRVKQATLTPLGLAELRGVRISKGADLSHGVLAEARRVIIKYDWVALVFGGKGAQSISRVEVYEPDLLLVRSSTGRFNVQDLLRPGPKRPPFLGRIVIYDGKTRFVDYAAKARKLPAVLRVSNVNGTINARAYPTYSFTVWGKGEPSVFSRSRAIGLYNSRQKWLRIDVTASDVSAQKATDYFGLWRSIQPASGRLKVVAGIKMLRDTRWKLQELTGVTDLRGVKTRIVGLSEPIESADGSIAFNGTNAVVSVVGASANSPIRITGAIENFSRPLLDLRVTSHRGRLCLTRKGARYSEGVACERHGAAECRGSRPVAPTYDYCPSTYTRRANTGRQGQRCLACRNLRPRAAYYWLGSFQADGRAGYDDRCRPAQRWCSPKASRSRE